MGFLRPLHRRAWLCPSASLPIPPPHKVVRLLMEVEGLCSHVPIWHRDPWTPGHTCRKPSGLDQDSLPGENHSCISRSVVILYIYNMLWWIYAGLSYVAGMTMLHLCHVSSRWQCFPSQPSPAASRHALRGNSARTEARWRFLCETFFIRIKYFLLRSYVFDNCF